MHFGVRTTADFMLLKPATHGEQIVLDRIENSDRERRGQLVESQAGDNLPSLRCSLSVADSHHQVEHLRGMAPSDNINALAG